MVHRALRQIGVRRCSAVPAKSNREAARWLYRLGYSHEGDHLGYGRSGETFCTWGKVF